MTAIVTDAQAEMAAAAIFAAMGVIAAADDWALSGRPLRKLPFTWLPAALLLLSGATAAVGAAT